MDKCWFCGYEGYLPTGWNTDKGEKLICPECDWKLDQILKHLDDDPQSESCTKGEAKE